MLANRILEVLHHIRILPRRMLLETPGVHATVPMLRGVWGAALHELDTRAYHTVFAPNDHAGPQSRHAGGRSQATERTATASPGYVLRPALPDPQFSPAIEWILIGRAVDYDASLLRGWDVASGMGLGPQRRRFHLRRTLYVRADGSSSDTGSTWPLSDVRWLGEFTAPCRLRFPAPLRLIRRGRLIESPALTDLVVAAGRRIAALLPDAWHATWEGISRESLDYARIWQADAWQGQRLDLNRYSASQRGELTLHGVSGWLDLPAGPGQLWPLLAAAGWLHLGKGTALGLGQLLAEPL